MNKDIISVFSNPFDVNVLPNNRNLWTVITTTILILILNIIVSLLCVVVLFDSFKESSKIFSAISILNIFITILTLVAEGVSTHVSDYMVKSYINVVEKIKNNNALMNLSSFEKIKSECSTNKSVVLKKISKLIQSICIITCIVCIVLTVYCNLSPNLGFVKAISLILSVVSIFISIYQTFVATISCYITGIYTTELFKTLYDYSKEIARKYNDAAIQLSQFKI